MTIVNNDKFSNQISRLDIRYWLVGNKVNMPIIFWQRWIHRCFPRHLLWYFGLFQPQLMKKFIAFVWWIIRNGVKSIYYLTSTNNNIFLSSVWYVDDQTVSSKIFIRYIYINNINHYNGRPATVQLHFKFPTILIFSKWSMAVYLQ